jgi:diacylglycerol kinase family enzyme
LPDVHFTRGRKFRVEAADGASVPVQVDGDIAGTLPLDIEVVVGGLTLLVPAKGAHRLGFKLPED